MIEERYRESITEVLAILDNTNSVELNKIPPKLLKFFRENCSKYYKVTFDENKEIKDLELKKETKGILSMLYFNYLCEPSKKNKYVELLKENSSRKEKELREKYDPDKVFKVISANKSKNRELLKIESTVNKQNEMMVYKDKFFKRIMEKIKSYFIRFFRKN